MSEVWRGPPIAANLGRKQPMIVTMPADSFTLRVSTPDDAAGVSSLLDASYSVLMATGYDAATLTAALPFMTKANPVLLSSGLYYIAEHDDGRLAGCGGWSLERPGTEEIVDGLGHIRHLAVHPQSTGCGVGRAIMDRCEATARAAGVARFECYASLNAEGFYKALGFTTRGTVDTGPVVSFNPYDGNAKPGSVGVAVPDTEIEIVDVDSGTRRLGQGEQSEIRVRGPQIMSGCHNRPEENAATLRDGWLYTGNIGECDADGYLYIRDRKKDMVIVGGYNVYTREIDEVLHGHDAVLEAAAVGVADDYRGESIHAYVVLKRGASANAGEILDHCRSNLAKYKLPGAITFVDALPKTTVGKIDKKALRALNPVPPAQ